MPPGSPAAELEVVDSSASSLTPHPAAADRAEDYGDDDRGNADLAKFSDQDLWGKIRYWDGMGQSLLRGTTDSGKKMQLRISRWKEELERRNRKVAQPRKDDTVQRPALQAKSTRGSGNDAYAFSHADEIPDSVASKYLKSCISSRTYTKVMGAACKERSQLTQGKCAYPKDGQIAKTSASQPKTRAHLPKSTDRDCLNMDIDNIKRTTLRSGTRYPQKNKTAGSKGMHCKFHEEDVTLGSTWRWNLSKNKVSSSSKLKKDVVVLDEDDDTEPARSADVGISNERDELKIYYPSRTDPDAVELTYSNMKCLEPEEYLKSPVINFCLQYLKQSRPRKDFYIFNTYFYSKLEEALSTLGDRDSQFRKLRRWWRSVDIFRKAYLILPINGRMHWSLIIVCMPTKDTESGPIMLHLDSLGLHSSRKLFDIVTSYLEAEWRHLQMDSFYKIPFSGTIWRRLLTNIKREQVEVPRQRNEYDCGLFMLHYIDRFIQEAPERFTKENLGMFGRKWFNHEAASGLRGKIRALLFDLFQSAQEDNGPSQALAGSQSGNRSDGEDEDWATW